MKSFTLLLFGLLLFTSVRSDNNSGQAGEKNTATASTTVSIGCTPDLKILTKTWVTGFNQVDPNANIALFDDVPTQEVNLQFSSVESLNSSEKPVWKMVVARQAIVPIMNSNNPLAEIFLSKGVSAKNWKEIVASDNAMNWSSFIETGMDIPVHFYLVDDQNVKSSVAKFLNTDQGAIYGTPVANVSELISAIQSDIYAIGFCSLPEIACTNGNSLPAGVSLMPIDKNGNGRLDRFENIYSDLESFIRGTWVGKYPKVLCRNIYALADVKPADKTQLAFLAWIMNDGQNLLNENGFTVLASNEKRNNISSLTGVDAVIIQPEEEKSNMALILIIGGILVAGVITIIIRSIYNGSVDTKMQGVKISSALNESSIEAPAGLYYDKSHTWAFMEKDGKVRIGIDDFLPHITGKLTKIMMKEPGEAIRKGEKILTLSKDGKQISIHAPVSGLITEQNNALLNNPGILSNSPYNYGWVYMIEPKNWIREIEFMFMRDKYRIWLKDEFERLRDFLSSSIKTSNSAYAHIVLQDGGELTSNVLSDLEPEVWEDFQTKFIDTSK